MTIDRFRQRMNHETCADRFWTEQKWRGHRTVHHKQQITRLEATCKMLNDRIKSISTETQHAGEMADEIPPHY